MTHEEWKNAEKKLSGAYGYIKLKIDGYNVTVEKMQLKEMQLCLAVFIDGKFKAQWALEDCDIRRRFCHKVTKKRYTNKAKAEFEKSVGKRAAAKFEKENADLFYSIHYEPFFGSFRTLKSQLTKNNSSIELAEDE